MSEAPPNAPAVHVRVFSDLEALSRAAAEHLIEVMEAALAERDRFSLVLAGGHTPLRLYELLRDRYRTRIAWDRTSVFWGDERYVPRDHPASNYGAAREALLRHVPLPPGRVFPIPTEVAPPEAAADAYHATLRRFFERQVPAFDLTLLGLGADGHTASLFPENAPQHALEQESAAWVEAVEAPPRYTPRTRITLTLPLLNRSRHVFFLVAGEDKRAPLQSILHAAVATLPAAFVRPLETLTWFVDEAAGGNGVPYGS